MAEDKGGKGEVTRWEPDGRSFRRDVLRVYGLKAQEIYSPETQTVRTMEAADGACRTYIKPAQGGEPRAEFLAAIDDYAAFSNEEGRTYTKVLADKDGASIVITAGRTGGKFHPFSHHKFELVNLDYEESLLTARFLPDDSPGDSEKTDPEQTWQDKVKVLMHLCQDDQIGKNDAMALIVEETIADLGGTDNHNVAAALALSDKAYEKILRQLPVREVEKYLDFFEKVALHEYLSDGALRELSFENLDGITIEELIDTVLGQMINELRDPREFQTYFQLSSFGASSFLWKEIAWESNTLNEIVSQKPGKISYEQERIPNQGEAGYGDTVAVQENQYKVDKKDGIVTVTCTTDRGKQLWQTSFALSLDSGNINLAIKNPNFDFRKLKDMLGISLTTP